MAQISLQLSLVEAARRTNISGHLSEVAQPSDLCRDSIAGPSAGALGRVVCELDIGRFKHLLSTDIDAATRQTVNRLLAEERVYLEQLLAAAGTGVAQK